ncbi:hypothetical protein [Kitasatospora sp. NPDC057595]|uniref:hypothetical protein n=1 Tax=Kitasatospora sp. NPDC057595 TaxID=3346177 RepID=UPI0036A3829D
MSLPGADELFRTTGGMALSPSLASRSAAEAPRPETARAVNGVGDADDAEGVDGAGATGGEGPEHADGGDGAVGDQAVARRAPRRAIGGPGAAGVPAPAQPGGQGATGTAAGKAAPGGRAAAPAPRQHPGAAEERPRPRGRAPRRPSGRERHDEKITVYVSAEELMDLEHARLVLRGEHGLAVDRGRIVREAIAVVLADLEQRGEASILVRRLRGR